jgi:hypothetical protein
MSQVAEVRLPSGAYRSTSKGDLAKFTDALQSIAQKNHGKVTKTEVLIWRGGDADPAMKNLPARLKDAGYAYSALPAFDAEPGHVTPFGAMVKNKPHGLLGLWIETQNKGDGYVLLAWGRYQSDNPAEPAVANEKTEPKNILPDPAPARIAPEAADPPAADPGSGKTPADLVGPTWSWTTISGVGYRDIVTKRLAAPSGMSARFTFTPDGRYDYFWYMRQRTYSLVTESTSTHQGRVTFNGDGTFTLYPAKGHYKGSSGSKIVDRPMTADEKKPMTFAYEWRNEEGKRQLYIGPSKSSLSRFKRENG